MTTWRPPRGTLWDTVAAVLDHWDIGISTGAYAGLALDVALLRIAELAPSAEVCSWGRHSLLERSNARAVSRSGLPFSVHGPFTHADFSSASEAKHRRALDVHRRHLAVAAELGAQVYVVHPDLHHRPRRRDGRVAAALERSFVELSALQQESGIVIAVENMPLMRHSHFTGPGDLELHGLGIVLDAGHAALTGTLAAWLAADHSALRLVHVHDNQGHPNGDQHLALGAGSVDVAPVIEAARAAGVTVVLEHISDAAVVTSLEHLRSRGLLVPAAARQRTS